MNQYETAKMDGNNGEYIVLSEFQNIGIDIIMVNELIDATVNGSIPVEIKTCLNYVKANDAKDKHRHGRFRLEKEQHDYLQHNNGVYVFVVLGLSQRVRMRVIPASIIPFRHTITWTVLYKMWTETMTAKMIQELKK